MIYNNKAFVVNYLKLLEKTGFVDIKSIQRNQARAAPAAIFYQKGDGPIEICQKAAVAFGRFVNELETCETLPACYDVLKKINYALWAAFKAMEKHCPEVV